MKESMKRGDSVAQRREGAEESGRGEAAGGEEKKWWNVLSE